MKARKMMGLFLTVALVIGLFPFAAGAASETDTAGNKVLYGNSPDKVETEGILEDVLASQSETIYIKAAGAITLTKNITISRKTVYFDLSGFTVTASADSISFIITNQGALTMSDTSTNKTGMVYSEYSGHLFRTQSGSSLTFDSGYYKTKKTNSVLLGADSTVTVNGGTFETAGSGPAAFSVNGRNAIMNINGGTFKAYSVNRPNIQYRSGKINLTDFDNTTGNLCVQNYSNSSEVIDISSFVESGEGFIIMDDDGAEITNIAMGKSFYIAYKHEVVFDFNGGSSTELRNYSFATPGGIPVPTWNQVTAPSSAQELSHWESGGKRYYSGSSVYVTGRGTTTLKAIWQDQEQYTVILHANNGSSDKIISTEWSTYTLPAELPSGWAGVEEGYYFAGWAQTPNGTPMTGQIRLLGDTELYAIIKLITYPVIYDGNGLEINMQPQEKTYNRTFTIPTRILEGRHGYSFKGWSETPDGTAVYQPGDKLSENRAYTLYAVWEINFSEFEVHNYDTRTKTATVFIPEPGTYTVIFTDYRDGNVVGSSFVTITPTEPTVVNLPVGNDITLGSGDKIMLWSGLAPLCATYVLQ